MIKTISSAKTINAVKKKLPITRSDKALNENLSWVADDLAEAYRIGAEEAQREILGRITKLTEKD